MASRVGLNKGLKSRHVHLIALGGIIGSSYFLGTGYIFNQVGPSVFLSYILGGLLTYLTMACLAELTIAHPRHGSFVTYAAEFISPSWACGVGWSYWINWVVYIPSECIAAGILMHNFVPEVDVFAWAALFGVLVTLINLVHVKLFGEMEFWLAMIKIGLIATFSVIAILIFFGVVGSTTHTVIKDEYIFQNGGLFPHGFAILLINMVVLISNFQGSEIIGLSASESENPEKDVPGSLKKTTYRIIGIYLIPTLLLVLIFPWQKAGLGGSVFAVALESYGFKKIAGVFSFLIIAGAISCANSGVYAAVRSLHALSVKRMAPKFLKDVHKHGIPVRATVVTFIAIWAMLLLSYFLSAHHLYANLLALSGFTGTICWISICWSQLKFRKSYLLSGQDVSSLIYKISLFPALTYFAIWLQVACLLLVATSDQLRVSFYFGVPAVLLPILIFKLHLLRKKTS